MTAFRSLGAGIKREVVDPRVDSPVRTFVECDEAHALEDIRQTPAVAELCVYLQVARPCGQKHEWREVSALPSTGERC